MSEIKQYCGALTARGTNCNNYAKFGQDLCGKHYRRPVLPEPAVVRRLHRDFRLSFFPFNGSLERPPVAALLDDNQVVDDLPQHRPTYQKIKRTRVNKIQGFGTRCRSRCCCKIKDQNKYCRNGRLRNAFFCRIHSDMPEMLPQNFVSIVIKE